MIEAVGLTRHYGATTALDGVSFTVPAGQICGYLGPNGAGKSTTVKILCGMLAPSAGRACVAGFDVARQPLEVKRRIGYVPEAAALYELLTPREYLELVAELFAMDPKHTDDRIERYFRLFDLAGAADRRVETLSKGMRQKLLIAAALVHDPAVILLDEPLDGLDVASARLVKDLLGQLAGQGKAVLYCSHILAVVERLCDRVIILHHGRMVADAPTSELLGQTPNASLEDVFQDLTTTSEEQRLARDLLASLRTNPPGGPL